jgi:hypothetical protein
MIEGVTIEIGIGKIKRVVHKINIFYILRLEYKMGWKLFARAFISAIVA